MQQVYPSELELAKESQVKTSGSVLEIDLSIKIKNWDKNIWQLLTNSFRYRSYQ